jgi:hypothetical protein
MVVVEALPGVCKNSVVPAGRTRACAWAEVISTKLRGQLEVFPPPVSWKKLRLAITWFALWLVMAMAVSQGPPSTT